MLKISGTKREIKEVRQGDENFMLTDGFIQYPRAMLHVLPECPADVRYKIMWAVKHGYLKCVAHVPGKEITWEQLIK